MKCSLLTLSTFIDGELSGERRAEVDAHLVGCERCGAGAATLREEKARVAQLARVQVDPESARLMLEQVGITADPTALLAHAATPAAPAGALPWESGAGGAALPWTPQRPAAHVLVEDAAAAPDDTQPDLPFENPASADTWEADLPPPLERDAEAADPWAAPSAPAAVLPPPLPPDPPVHSTSSPPVPTRLPAVSGPAGLWNRARDAVALRLALAHGEDHLDDSVRIVSGAAPARGAILPAAAATPPPEIVAAAAAAAERLAAEATMQSSVELNGTRGIGLRSHEERRARAGNATDVTEHLSPPPPPPAAPASAGRAPAVFDDRWNAFAASSYPAGVAIEPPEAPPPRKPIGRHGRALSRQGIGMATRVSGALAATASAARTGTVSAAAAVRRAIASRSGSGPDNRVLAGIAGVGLVFVVALLIGHAAPAAHPATAAKAAPSATHSSAAPLQSAGAGASSPANPSSPAIANVQSFGAGASGLVMRDLRYGKQAGYTRMVFDLVGGTGTKAGTPRVTVVSSGGDAMLVTFEGTAPAASVGTPPTGSVITSVTLVTATSSGAEYRIGLSRPATATAFFLVSPTRFVLDLH